MLFDLVLYVNSMRRWLELFGLKPSSAAFERCLDNSAQTKFTIPKLKIRSILHCPELQYSTGLVSYAPLKVDWNHNW
jgi:hypothetical protein